MGVNRFVTDDQAAVPILRIDEQLESQQIERLKRIRARRDNSEVSEALNKIEQAALTDDNLMPYIIHAVEAYTTLGEISDRLRAVFGEYKAGAYE